MTAMVRFATVCDAKRLDGQPCGARSPEYTGWPTCRTCGDDVCPEHMVEGTLIETDGVTPCSCECKACEREAECRVDAAADAERDPRERDDDDGVQYADPRDEMEERMFGGVDHDS